MSSKVIAFDKISDPIYGFCPGLQAARKPFLLDAGKHFGKQRRRGQVEVSDQVVTVYQGRTFGSFGKVGCIGMHQVQAKVLKRSGLPARFFAPGIGNGM